MVWLWWLVAFADEPAEGPVYEQTVQSSTVCAQTPPRGVEIGGFVFESPSVTDPVSGTFGNRFNDTAIRTTADGLSVLAPEHALLPKPSSPE
jgi:hypothetical protein